MERRHWNIMYPEETKTKGNTYTNWIKVGVLFLNERGVYTIKLSAVPITNQFTGWLAVMNKEDKAGGSGNPSRTPKQQQEADTKKKVEQIFETEEISAEDIP